MRQELLDHRKEVVERLVRIEDKLDSHKHGQYVSWVALVPVLVAVVIGVMSVL